MSEQTITVNSHSLAVFTPEEGWVRLCHHQGPCTDENCGRFLPGLNRVSDSRAIINRAIDAVRGGR